MVLLRSWQIGDRVYLVAAPNITGTIVNVLRHSCLVQIRPDADIQTNSGYLTVQSAALEHYTRPEIGAHLTTEQRALAWRLKALLDRGR